MTRHEIRIAAAKKKAAKAEAKWMAAHNHAYEAREAFWAKITPRLSKATRAYYDALFAVTAAELAAKGIAIDETIVTYEGRNYVVIRRDRWAKLARVNRRGEIMKHIYPARPPWKWEGVTATDRKVAE